MVSPLDSPQPVFAVPNAAEIPDDELDRPRVAVLSSDEASGLPPIIFGAAALSHHYNNEEHLAGSTPVRTVRLALRYGISAFDTSPYYGVSEIVLGASLKALEAEFPRSSYVLMTKCGRYGGAREDFDYSPATIRKSVERSLKRLNTTYLDVVYLHDTEYVCERVEGRSSGDHSAALTSEQGQYGLREDQEAKVWGEGDQKILDAVTELRKMKQEGLVKQIGITGYPLPVLLRLAILVRHTAPYEPLDVLLNYSHLHLQNDTFALFAPYFKERAGIKHIVTASPLNMGLLTPAPPPWHPAPPALQEAARKASDMCLTQEWKAGLPDLALGYAYTKAKELGVPTVVGLSKPEEVHGTMKVWHELNSEGGDTAAVRRAAEGKVLEQFLGFRGDSWASPPVA